jgi:hypothetical protein
MRIWNDYHRYWKCFDTSRLNCTRNTVQLQTLRFRVPLSQVFEHFKVMFVGNIGPAHRHQLLLSGTKWGGSVFRDESWLRHPIFLGFQYKFWINSLPRQVHVVSIVSLDDLQLSFLESYPKEKQPIRSRYLKFCHWVKAYYQQDDL